MSTGTPIPEKFVAMVWQGQDFFAEVHGGTLRFIIGDRPPFRMGLETFASLAAYVAKQTAKDQGEAPAGAPTS